MTLLIRMAVSTVILASTIMTCAFLGMGTWLVREDPLQNASAIAVLSGYFPVRALEAARLYHAGYAKEIWLTHPTRPSGKSLEDFGIHLPTEDDFDRLMLLRSGVPPHAIHILDTPVSNTADELDVIGTNLHERGSSIIIVTNKAHTRRVHVLWRKYEASCGQLIVHAVEGDTFDAAHWWRTQGDATQVLHEVLGIVNAWAGLPVQSPVRFRETAIATSEQPDLVEASE